MAEGCCDAKKNGYGSVLLSQEDNVADFLHQGRSLVLDCKTIVPYLTETLNA